MAASGPGSRSRCSQPWSRRCSSAHSSSSRAGQPGPEDGDGPQLPHPRGQSRRLGVDHAGRRLLPQPVPRLLGRRYAAAQQVREALLQLRRARRDPLGPPLRPPAAPRRRDPRRRPASPHSAAVAPPLAAPGQPLLRPLRRLAAPAPRRPARRPEQQQPQRVLARELAARTTALVRRARRIRDVDDRLVRLAAAALAQPPHRPLVRLPASDHGPATPSLLPALRDGSSGASAST